MATSPYQIEDVARFAMGDMDGDRDIAQPHATAAPLPTPLRVGAIVLIVLLAAAALAALF